MRILGIDPGIGRTGWGMVVSNKGQVTGDKFGCIETEANVPLNERLLILFNQLVRIVGENSPDVIVIEELFF